MRIVRRFIALAALGSLIASAAEEKDETLRGIVKALGSPIAEAEVAAGVVGWVPAAGNSVAVAKSDREGRFEMRGAPYGPVDLWVRRKGAKWKFVIRMSSPGVNELEVDAGFTDELPRVVAEGTTTINGLVTDQSGKLIPRAAVGARGDDSTWVLADAKGQFTLGSVCEGDGLVVRAPGFQDLLIPKLKIEKQRMTFRLATAKPTVVHVTDPAGQPVVGAWVVLGDTESMCTATAPAPTFPPRPRLVGGWTDAKGEARVAWGGDDEKTVASAYSPRFATASKAIVARGAGVELQLAPPRPVRATATLRASGLMLPNVLIGVPPTGDPGAAPAAPAAKPSAADRGPLILGKTDESGVCLLRDLDPKIEKLQVVGEMKTRGRVQLERVEPGK